MSIPLSDFEATARRRLDDAMFLVVHDRYDSAVYLGGYALEIALKISVAKKNGLHDVPESISECNDPPYVDKTVVPEKRKYYCTHKLAFLLSKSNTVNSLIMSNSTHKTAFDLVKNWSPEDRYKNSYVGNSDALDVIEAIESLLKVVL